MIDSDINKKWVQFGISYQDYLDNYLDYDINYVSVITRDQFVEMIGDNYRHEEMIVMKNPEGRIRVLYRKGKLKDLSLYPRVIGDTSIKEGNYNVENAVWKHRRVINKGVSRGV